MPTYNGTLMIMVAWMPSASPAVLCGGQTSYSITSTACLGPFPFLALPRVAISSEYALISHPPPNQVAMLPWKLPPRTLLTQQENAGSGGYMAVRLLDSTDTGS